MSGVIATEDSYTIAGGNATLTAAFGGTDYVAAVTEPSPVAAHFNDVELTNATGQTYAYNGYTDVLVSATKPYGSATLTLTLSETSAAALQAICGGTAKQLVVTLGTPEPDSGASNKVRIHAVAPTSSYVDADIVLTLKVAADGTFALYQGENSLGTKTGLTEGVWTINFYYSVAGTNGQSTSAAETALHANDKIEVSFGTLQDQ